MKRFLIMAAAILALSNAAMAGVACDADANCMASSPRAQAPAPAPPPAPTVVYVAPSGHAVPVAGCDTVVYPVGLEKFGDNNLSVHPSPIHPSATTEVDELVPRHQPFKCFLHSFK